MDSLRTEKLYADAGVNHPKIFKLVQEINGRYIHRHLEPYEYPILSRPRQDTAHFLWAGIPSPSFNRYDAPELPYAIHHTTRDHPGIITPEIMDYLAQLVFTTVVELAGIHTIQ